MYCVIETLEHTFDEYEYEKYEHLLFVGTHEECEEVLDFVKKTNMMNIMNVF